MLFGPTERIELAEELINKFEQKGGSGDVRIYQPQTVKADELANMIRQAIPGVAGPNESGSAAATKARLIADTAQNRLIVAAPLPGQAEQIEQLVSRITRQLESLGETEIPSSTVGDFIMKALKSVDEVAYVRYASVYKDFRHTGDFARFLGAEGLDES